MGLGRCQGWMGLRTGSTALLLTVEFSFLLRCLSPVMARETDLCLWYGLHLNADQQPVELITSTSRSSSLSTNDTFPSTTNTSPAVSTCDIFAPQSLMRAAAVSYDFDPSLSFIGALKNPTWEGDTFSLEPNINFKSPTTVGSSSRVDPPATATITNQLCLSPESLTSPHSTGPADLTSRCTRKSTRKRAGPGSYVDTHPLDSLPLDDETSSAGGPSEKKIKLVVGGGKGKEKAKEVKKEIEETEVVEVGKKGGEKEDKSAMSKKDRRRASAILVFSFELAFLGRVRLMN